MGVRFAIVRPIPLSGRKTSAARPPLAISARIRMRDLGWPAQEDVADLQTDDFGKRQARAEGEAEGEMVARVGGGHCQDGRLLGLGQGLGG